MKEKLTKCSMRPCYFLLLFIVLSECGIRYDAERAGKFYCRCMKENQSPDQYLFATKVCEGELIKENRFFRIFTVDMQYSHLDSNVPKATRDSVQGFMSRFDAYLRDHCCNEALRCPIDSTIVM